MKRSVSDFLWREGARLIMIAVFVLSVISKLIDPNAFFTMTASFGTALNISEVLYSLIISIEFLLILLLILKPMPGLLWSAILLGIYTITIFGLRSFEFGEVYGCFGDIASNEVSFGKILQNIGLAMLLISSWLIRRNSSSL